LMGGAYTRYVIGDVIEITALRDEEANINLPQMAFFGRADGNIDLELWAHVYFTEKLVWQGIVNSGVPYVDWVARKEVESGGPILSLYIEPKDINNFSEEEVTNLIHEEFKKLMQEYMETDKFLGVKPIRVKLLPAGAFSRYIEYKRAAGADLAHIKPPHMNPSDSIVRVLTGEQLSVVPVLQKNNEEVKTQQ